jgi:cellulose biosynthesis protein BcsQ
MAHVIAVGNRKGGVGKTSYVLNLANALQIIGCRVLVGDLDPLFYGLAAAGVGVLAAATSTRSGTSLMCSWATRPNST